MSNRSDCFQTTDIVNNKLVEFPKEIADAINAGIQVNESTSPPAVESPTSHERAQSPVEGRKENQDTITGWANATFGPADSNIRIAARANEEMAELLRALSADDDNPKAAEEIADVVIVLYRVASRLGYDLHRMIDKKMEINRGREWKLDNTGHGYHVRNKSVTPTETPTATPSAAVGADEPGAGDEKEWCDGAKEFCERQVESDTVPRAEYDRVVKLNHHLREAAVMAISERVPSDSKPTNFHNPESEDTPPHNPVLGPIVGTATVKHQTSCPAATAPTVPPEVGKRYVCRNGVVTPLMKSDTLTGRNQPYYFCDIDGTTTYWGHDGRGYVGRQDDLIAEYHEPEPSPPAESPDVSGEIRGLKYALQWIDAKRAGNPKLKVAAWEMLNDMQVHFEAAVARLQDGESINSTSHVDKPAESPDDWVVITDPEHKARIGIDWFETDTGWILQSEKHIDCTVGEFAELSGGKRHCCRRKDLPVVPAESPASQPSCSPVCALCGNVATCFGQYADHDKGFACDSCCGHGNEDGWCMPVVAVESPSLPSPWKDIEREQPAIGDRVIVLLPFGMRVADDTWTAKGWLNNRGDVSHWMPINPPGSCREIMQRPAPADKPRMRQITLREYSLAGRKYWTTFADVVSVTLTGRTCVTEVPE